MKQSIRRLCLHGGSRLAKAYSVFLQDEFKVNNIDDLHSSIHLPCLKHGTDQATPIHNALYAEFDKDKYSPLVKVYRELQQEWIHDLRKNHEARIWAIQRYPSVRVHLPGNISVFEFHRDSEYNHPLGEINHFLSINQSRGSASLQIEQDLGWENYQPLELDAGQSAIINTSIFKHGDFLNNENYTRVSIDFRAIPLLVLENLRLGKSVTKGKIFDCSDYFISSEEL